MYCARRFYIDRLRIWRDVSICGNPVTQIVRDPKWKFCGNVAKTVYVASGATNTNDGEVVESGEPAKCSYIVAIYRWPLSINISFLIKNKVLKKKYLKFSRPPPQKFILLLKLFSYTLQLHQVSGTGLWESTWLYSLANICAMISS